MDRLGTEVEDELDESKLGCCWQGSRIRKLSSLILIRRRDTSIFKIESCGCARKEKKC
jgi:hypothetical protein